MKKMGVKPKLVVQYDSDDSDSEKSAQNSAEEESEQEENDDFQFSDEDDESDLNESDGEDMDDDDDDDSENDDEDKTEVPTETVQKDESDSNKESDDEDDDSEEMDVDDEDDGDGNKGWADSISKILNTKKPAKKKSLVLSKAKLLADSKKEVPKPKSAGFEIVKEDGNVDEAKIEVAVKKNEKKRKEDSAKIMKLSIKGLRKMPNALERPRERALSKIATKGVVQLFNAVRKQQKEIKDKLEEAGPMESKKEKAMMSIDRGAFLDSLKKDKSVLVDNLDVMKNLGKKQQKDVEETESSWSVLQPNFRMGANLKDWDKKDEEEQEMEEEIEFA